MPEGQKQYAIFLSGDNALLTTVSAAKPFFRKVF